MAKTKKNTRIKHLRGEPLAQLEDVQCAMRLAAPRVRRLKRGSKSSFEKVLERPEALNRLKEEWSPEELAMAERQVAKADQREQERRTDRVGPTHSEKGGQSISLRRHKKKPRANETIRGLLADGDLCAIRARIEADFAKNVELKIETFVHPIVAGVARGRLAAPVNLGSSELERLAAGYCHTVREAVGAYAEVLVQAVANRRRTGSKQLQLIMQEANRIIRKKTSPAAASALIDSIGAYLQVADSKAAEDVLVDRLRKLGDGPVKKDVAAKMRHAVALYGGEQRLEPTLCEKVANPALCPTMTVTEVAQVLKKSRSTVYRYLDEGKLTRARLRGAILTTSVASLLK